MYISSNGSNLLTEDAIIKDQLDIYFKLDQYDVPFRNLGIRYTFTKSNLYEAIAYLRLVCSVILEHINNSKLTLKDIKYDKGTFNIIFDYDGRTINYELDNQGG